MDDLSRYKELKATILYHNDRYYNQDNPEITDYEYDMMMQELKGLEQKHPEYITSDSPTQKLVYSYVIMCRCYHCRMYFLRKM